MMVRIKCADKASNEEVLFRVNETRTDGEMIETFTEGDAKIGEFPEN